MKSWQGRIFVAAVVIAFAGCAVPRPPVRIQSPFNAEETAGLMRPGPNTIAGSALIRQQGGAVVTCAGAPVLLYPATDYAKERQYATFGSGHFINPYQRRQVEPDPPEFSTLTRSTTCNAQGFFKFDNVADGEFILLTRIIWTAGRYHLEEGGFVLGRAIVRGGQTTDVTLTP